MVAVTSLVVGVAVHILTRGVFVSQSQCGERRKGVCDAITNLERHYEEARIEQDRKTKILFRMVRAMVVHNKDMPSDVKERVLNETTGAGQ